jgi:hypothetical protein
MKDRYCYWSVVDGSYAPMMQTVVDSARQVGVFKDFHVWTDQPIAGAVSHPVEAFDKTLYLFKLRFLRDEVSRLDYDYFVWLDADSYFVRDPGDLLRVMEGSPVHASLESDACLSGNVRPDWWGCSLKDYVTLMRFMGVRSRAIYNVNAGFWIVHRDVIKRFYELAFEFWDLATRAGFEFTEEPPLAYATHMLCGNPHVHTLRHTSDVWASDWTGAYDGRLPDGKPWEFVDYFSHQGFQVNPAIVHAMRSKEVLQAMALSRSRAFAAPRADPVGGRGRVQDAGPRTRRPGVQAAHRLNGKPGPGRLLAPPAARGGRTADTT